MTYSYNKIKIWPLNGEGMFGWIIVKKKIKDLKNNPKNPRKITKQQQDLIKKSIGRFGLVEKPILNLDNTIIGGHQRIAILKQQGHSTVDCWVPDRQLQEKDLDDFNLMLNRVHADFDYDMLANMFEIPDLLECGFNVDELQIGDVEEVEEKEQKTKKKLSECPACGHQF